jgi:RimJ/RimL family protein N-acetyltransferase
MIVFNNHAHGHVIAQAANIIYNPNVDQVIARTNVYDELAGGVIYREYTGASIQMHVASFCLNWLSRDLLWVCFDYPFNQLGCSKVFGPVPEHNEQALAFDLRLGFKYDAIIRGVFHSAGNGSTGDLLLLSMRREDCPWLKLKPKSFKDYANGRQSPSSPCAELSTAS